MDLECGGNQESPVTVKTPPRLDIFLGLFVAICAVFSIWLIISINKTLDDARKQMRTMPRDFLVDVINTQNHINAFQQQMQQYLKNPSEQGLNIVRGKQERLASRAELLRTSLVRLNIPVSSAGAFTEELGYLKTYIHDLGTMLNDPTQQLNENSAKVGDLLTMIEDSMAFLFTEANVLLHRQANHQIDVLSSMSTTLSVLVVIVMVMFVGLVLTLRKLYQQRFTLQKLVTKDALTSLQNRRGFDKIIKPQFARVKRTGGQLSLLVLDLDHFKEFNDTYGHAQGDEALIRVAKALRNNMKRQDDWAFRLGGEEFGCLLSTDTGIATQDIAEHLCKEIMGLNIAHSASPTAEVLTISIGVAQLPDDDIHTVNDLFVSADEALYEAKKGGRNQVCIGQPVIPHLRIVPEAVI